jgi:carbon starvation protein CstA
MLRARIEAGFAVVAAALAAATLIWPTWIETVFSFEPDNGSGETEWWIVIAFALVAATLALLARRDYKSARRLNADPT